MAKFIKIENKIIDLARVEHAELKTIDNSQVLEVICGYSNRTYLFKGENAEKVFNELYHLCTNFEEIKEEVKEEVKNFNPFYKEETLEDKIKSSKAYIIDKNKARRAYSTFTNNAEKTMLENNCVSFKDFYNTYACISKKTYSIATISQWVAYHENARNEFVKDNPIKDKCKTIEDCIKWWEDLNNFKRERKNNQVTPGDGITEVEEVNMFEKDGRLGHLFE